MNMWNWSNTLNSANIIGRDERSAIFVHIGTMKTGTTYIQHLFHNNAATLEQFNIYYPHITPPDLHLLRYANGNFILGIGQMSCPEQPLLRAGFSTLISEETLLFNIENCKYLARSICPRSQLFTCAGRQNSSRLGLLRWLNPITLSSTYFPLMLAL